MKTHRRISAAIAALLTVSLVSCGPIDYLQLAINAAEIALPLIAPAAGVDQGTVNQVSGYLTAASQAITKAIDIESGTGTQAEKVSQIVAAFGGIAAPIVPSKYQALANAVKQVAAYIAEYLASLPANPSPAVQMQLTPREKAKAATVRTRAETVSQRARLLKRGD